MMTDRPIGLCTNVLLRWLLGGSLMANDAPSQTAAARGLLNDRHRSFFVNDVVLAETVWIVRKKLKRDKLAVASLVEGLLAASNVLVENEDVIRAAVQAYLAGPADLADELIAQINHAAGCQTTLTFDADAGRSPLFTLVS